MNQPSIITGFLSIVYNESRRLIKGSISSYFWFILLVSISAYGLSAEKYADITIDRSVLALKYGDNPMADVLIYTTSFAISSSSDIISGKVPQLIFPTSIGIVFFIVFPLMLGLTMIGNFAIKKASETIAGEKEKKTLGINTRIKSSVYLGKFFAILLLTLPMVGFLYFITRWVFTNLFFSQADLSGLVLETAFVALLLFASIGMFLSVLCKNEKTASRIGRGIAAFSALMTTTWISIPFIEFLSNLINKDTGFLFSLEKATWLSPYTLDLMSVYAPAVSTDYFNIQLIASFIFLFVGMVTFIRQDIEY